MTFYSKRIIINAILVSTIFILCYGRITAQNVLPIEVEQALGEVSRVIVMISTDGDTRHGTGIMIGFDESFAYVITADHVVWRGATPRPNVRIDIKYPNGDVASIKNVEVTPNHDPAYEEATSGLDLAVIRFDRSQYKFPLEELDFNIIGRSSDLLDREEMYSIGYADNGTQWNLNPQPELFSRLNPPRLLFGTPSMTPGYSGGPLFNSKFQLVGMITEDTPPNGSAVTIDAINAKLRTWSHVPNHLRLGPGRIIVKDADRLRYLLGDAKASISIFLPMGNPTVKAFSDKTKAAMEAFSKQYPRYNNERPREVFYVSYDERDGRFVPSNITIYTDSPFWPSYADEPLMSLLTRIQTTTIHFYKRPINPQEFNPDNSGADLSVGFSKNWVKYVTLANQIQAENAGGRLELSHTFYNNTLEQFVWNALSPKNRWRDNGAIGSILDLRGGMIIISTVVGNLASRRDLEGDFSELRRGTKLNYINLSLGSRSIDLGPENTERFIDKNGNPFYVMQLPRTSQELLRIFK